MENLEKLAELFKALSDPTRLKLVKFLSQHKRPKCVNALTKSLNISQSAVSQHLKVLKQADIVIGERRGNFVHYEYNGAHMESIKKRLLESEGNDFLVIDSSGLFSFGSDFWTSENQIRLLEDHLTTLQKKTSEIESILQQLKKKGN